MNRKGAHETRVFAAEQLQEMAGGDRALMQELIDLYAGHDRMEWPMLLGAVREEDWEQVRQLAHALKGSSMTIGAESAARALQLVEEGARARRTDSVDAAVADAHGAYVSACRQMRALMTAA